MLDSIYLQKSVFDMGDNTGMPPFSDGSLTSRVKQNGVITGHSSRLWMVTCKSLTSK